ncbi:DNA cytosine methyltransferase [Paenibacillus doosanensis]|uniref:DNA cytosine methyltransferase n=1 Tax=Paenibacillus doosanensis TaxID=1229154 RepID=UPI0021800510|nr:DNA cytosine methyltransferase [Paenibacillus doosanensis]MCS7460833.1 DNA cytosine methyltransferase [Paenibacillus doosanensis]
MSFSTKYKVLDLFSGAGGMAEGFLQAGFSIPAATDYSKEASLTYINRHKQLELNFNYYQGDIADLTKKSKLNDLLDGNSVDVVVGGPPCQGFSLTGKRLSDDPRNILFIKYLKIIQMSNPRYFVMENVLGILSFRINKIKGVSGKEYNNELVTKILESEALLLGYKVRWKVLNAKDFGVPQNRPRVIFFGHKIRKRLGKIYDYVVPAQFPCPIESNVSVYEALSDLSFLKNGEKSNLYLNMLPLSDYQKKLRIGQTPNKNGIPITSLELHNHEASKHNPNTIRRFSLLSNGEKISDLLKRLSKSNVLPDEYEKMATKKRSCIKLIREGISPTILTLPDDIIHYDPKNPRILTVRELARLQSFDDSFIFLGKRTTGGDRRRVETPQYTQVGNAVPPFFSRSIALKIKEALLETDKK